MKLLVAMTVIVVWLQASVASGAGSPSEIGNVVIEMHVVCVGVGDFEGSMNVAVGDMADVLACDSHTRHVRHRSFALVDRADPWTLVLRMTFADGLSLACDFAGQGLPERRYDCSSDSQRRGMKVYFDIITNSTQG